MTAPASSSILFFSRGRGRGHAVRDLAIATELRKLLPDAPIEFVSYAVGADTLRARGEQVIDLGLSEDNEFVDTVVSAGQVTRTRQPAVVVAHEEPAALAAAKVFGLPTVFVTHWFMEAMHLWSTSLRFADEVVFLGDPGVFDEPPGLRGPVHYVGPVRRPLMYGPDDRLRARAELGVEAATRLIVVLPGSPSEALSPIGDLLLSAFDLFPAEHTRLVWIAGPDRAAIDTLRGDRPNVLVLETDWQVERWMVAADLAVTKGTYNSMLELTTLGVPTITLSHGRNHIDDLLAQLAPGNMFLWARELTPARLAEHMEHRLAGTRPSPRTISGGSDAAARAAGIIATHVGRPITPSPR